jgi:hypothetical protein
MTPPCTGLTKGAGAFLCVRSCMLACMHVYVRACVRACVCACLRVPISTLTLKNKDETLNLNRVRILT